MWQGKNSHNLKKEQEGGDASISSKKAHAIMIKKWGAGAGRQSWGAGTAHAHVRSKYTREAAPQPTWGRRDCSEDGVGNRPQIKLTSHCRQRWALEGLRLNMEHKLLN